MNVCAENKCVMKRNKAVLNDLCTIEANDKFPDNCKYSLTTIQAAQNQKQTNTEGLAKLLLTVIFKLLSKVMLTVNLDILDHLINGQIGNSKHIVFAQGSVGKVYIKINYEPGNLKAMRSSSVGKQYAWVSIE